LRELKNLPRDPLVCRAARSPRGGRPQTQNSFEQLDAQ
jgi:hypothetical protein